MTQFRGLPVWRGDAYLLKSRRGTYLVDGGDFSGGLPRMLRERRVGKLRAAVCTFPSPDRLGGILDLLSDGYPLKECWLPVRLGVIESMARHFDGDWPGWCSLFGNHVQPNSPPFCPPAPGLHTPATILTGLALAGCPGGAAGLPSRTADSNEYLATVLNTLAQRAASRWKEQGAGLALRNLGQTLFQGGGDRELIIICCNLIINEADTMPTNDPRIPAIKGLALAAMASVLTSEVPHVRYFRPSKNLQQHLIARHPLVCLNGVETHPEELMLPEVKPAHLFREARKTTCTGQGLAFQYGDGHCDVLFCGNSQFSFLKSNARLSLRRPTVITAPGQGGAAFEKAYARIESNDPQQDIWVRAHYSYARKISEIYKRLPHKICLNDSITRSLMEVVLQFDGTRWRRLAGRACH